MKQALAKEIIGHIKNLNPPGRFLKREGSSKNSRGLDGPWVEKSEKEVMKKATQALRDCNRQDRSGYAAQVEAPQDVQAEETKRSGVPLKEYAAAKVHEGSGICESDRKRPPPSSAASTRRKRSSPEHFPAKSVDNEKIQSMDEPLPVLSQEPPLSHAPDLQSSASHVLPTFEEPVEATPGHPHVAPVPVTETPGVYHPDYRPHHIMYASHQYPRHHHLLYSGSPPVSSIYHAGEDINHYQTPQYSPVRSRNLRHDTNDDDVGANFDFGQQLNFGTTNGPEEDPFDTGARNVAASFTGAITEDTPELLHHDHHRSGSNENIASMTFLH